MQREELKEKLLKLDVCKDNEYLDKYVELIISNNNTVKQKGKTQRHHIIPRYYYKENKLTVDNSSNNLVNLLYKDHILGHCYLCLCAKTDFGVYSNFVTLSYIFGNALTIQNMTNIIYEEIKNLDAYQQAYEKYTEIEHKYNCMNDKDVYNKHNKIMKSDKVRGKISSTMKQKAEAGELFTEEHRKHLSEAARRRSCKGTNMKENTTPKISKNGYIGGVTGLKMIYDTEGNRHYIEPSLVEIKLNEGWTLPTNKKKSSVTYNTTQKHTYKRHMNQVDVHKHLSESHKGIKPGNYGKPMTEETKEKLRAAIQGKRWMNNGVVQIQVAPCDVDNYIKEGFKYGRLKR